MDQFGIMVGLQKENSFEGWFCKVDDEKNGMMFSVIWGYSTHLETGHAFLQFQHSMEHDTIYVSYPLAQMSWQVDPFVLKIGKNILSKEGMHLDFEEVGRKVTADISFQNFTPIRQSFWKPSIMGWLTYFPNECNHSIISMQHSVSGYLQMDVNNYVIEKAYGYIEKDWGKSFPKEYVWLQANDWKDSAVVFSYATVPVLGKFAKGFFVVVIHEGVEYRLSSIEGSKLEDFHVYQDSFRATASKGRVRITLSAKQANSVALVSPHQGEMKSYIKESLDGDFELNLEVCGKQVTRLASSKASIDVHFMKYESQE